MDNKKLCKAVMVLVCLSALLTLLLKFVGYSDSLKAGLEGTSDAAVVWLMEVIPTIGVFILGTIWWFINRIRNKSPRKPLFVMLISSGIYALLTLKGIF